MASALTRLKHDHALSHTVADTLINHILAYTYQSITYCHTHLSHTIPHNVLFACPPPLLLTQHNATQPPYCCHPHIYTAVSWQALLALNGRHVAANPYSHWPLFLCVSVCRVRLRTASIWHSMVQTGDRTILPLSTRQRLVCTSKQLSYVKEAARRVKAALSVGVRSQTLSTRFQTDIGIDTKETKTEGNDFRTVIEH